MRQRQSIGDCFVAYGSSRNDDYSEFFNKLLKAFSFLSELKLLLDIQYRLLEKDLKLFALVME